MLAVYLMVPAPLTYVKTGLTNIIMVSKVGSVTLLRRT
jgi:uncharacterized membrane protein